MYFAVILVACVPATFGEIMNGVCDTSVKPVDSIDVGTIGGLWYAYASIGDDTSTRCPVVRIQLEKKKPVYDRVFIENGEVHEIRDLVYYKDRQVFFPEKMFSQEDSEWHLFLILTADLSNSAILHLCKQITPETKKIIAWKFSKDPAIPELVRANNDEVARRYPELASASWRELDRDNCPETSSTRST